MKLKIFSPNSVSHWLMVQRQKLSFIILMLFPDFSLLLRGRGERNMGFPYLCLGFTLSTMSQRGGPAALQECPVEEKNQHCALPEVDHDDEQGTPTVARERRQLFERSPIDRSGTPIHCSEECPAILGTSGCCWLTRLSRPVDRWPVRTRAGPLFASRS